MDGYIENSLEHAGKRGCHYIYQFHSPSGALTINGMKVYQFADVFCKKEYVQQPHRQACDELTIVYGGSGSIFTNGVKCDAKIGQLHLCFEGDTHLLQTNPVNTLRFFCLGFRLLPQHPLYNTYQEMKKRLQEEKRNVVPDEHGVMEKCKNAITELMVDGESELSKNLFSNLLGEIIALTCKNFLRLKYTFEYDYSPKQSLVYDIINFLDEHVRDKDALQALPQAVNYSYSHVSHVFSRCVGENLKEYFFKLRMHAADTLLKNGKSVTEISDTFGYSSIHAFSRAYKSFFGVSPIHNHTDP